MRSKKPDATIILRHAIKYLASHYAPSESIWDAMVVLAKCHSLVGFESA